MSQLALKIRSLVAQRKGLQDCVGVCDDFQVSNKAISLKAHLNTFTQEDKPLLGNPKHPELLFDECEQMIIPIHWANHVGVAVVKLTIEEEGKRKAFVQYFDGTGSDLADDLLTSLGAFFTENEYEVLYHCVSEAVAQQGSPFDKMTCLKAIELANQNAGIKENLLIPVENPERKETISAAIPEPTPAKTPSNSSPWLLMVLALGAAIYMGFDYLQPYKAAVMSLIPANPLYAFIACGGVFCTGWLLVSCLQYLTRERETPSLRFSEKRVSEEPEDVASQITMLHAYARYDGDITLQKAELNKKAIAQVRSLRLN